MTKYHVYAIPPILALLFENLINDTRKAIYRSDPEFNEGDIIRYTFVSKGKS